MTEDATTVTTVGAWVLVRGGQGDELELYRIVPPEDSDPLRSQLSEASPVARALLGRRAGERVRVQGPVQREVTILRVWGQAHCYRVVGGTAGVVEDWQEVLTGAKSVRPLGMEVLDGDGLGHYEVRDRRGNILRYLVDESRS